MGEGKKRERRGRGEKGGRKLEIDRKTNQMTTSKSYLFRTFYSKGVGHHHLCLTASQRQAEKAL